MRNFVSNAEYLIEKIIFSRDEEDETKSWIKDRDNMEEDGVSFNEEGISTLCKGDFET